MFSVTGVIGNISWQSLACLTKVQVVGEKQVQLGVVMAQAPAAEHQR